MTPVVLHGDVLDVLPTLADASVDAVVCDPPYSLSFMGASWDRHPTPLDFQAWCQAWATECLRVLKPGGHLLAFGGTRTVHRLTSGVEDAGFEIRDGIDWLYGSGFPKSFDVSRALDKAAGAEREVTGPRRYADGTVGHWTPAVTYAQDDWSTTARGKVDTAPATDAARQWAGWGTALKPAREPIVVARKPLDGTVATTVQQHGTGALNIDACRVPHDGTGVWGGQQHPENHRSVPGGNGNTFDGGPTRSGMSQRHDAGRWPTNVIMSHAGDDDTGDACADGCVPGCAIAELDAQSGSASRFYPVFRYQAKAPTRERPKVDGVSHSTVKPLALMRWLVRLVTPPGGHVLDPFAGSGTTVEACILEGYQVTAVEKHGPYLPLIDARIARATTQ